MALTGDEDGGADVSLYEVQWDEGRGTTQFTLTTTSDLSYAVTTTNEGLTPGFPYKFMYRAFNKYGWGEYSDEATHFAAAIPSQVGAATTQFENNFAKISWDYPDDGANEVLEYLIENL